MVNYSAANETTKRIGRNRKGYVVHLITLLDVEFNEELH